MSIKLLAGDCREVLKTLPEASVQCCVTSPPYFGLRSYLPVGHPDKHLEIGLEQTPEDYVAQLVDVFREVRRVLRDDGTLWLNLGDSYAQGGSGGASSKSTLKNNGRHVYGAGDYERQLNKIAFTRKPPRGYKPKDLLGIPWRVAFALQADGWWLRSAIVWHKPSCMPESVRDRPTCAYEHVFLLAKSERYFYDSVAIQERSITDDPRRPYTSQGAKDLDGRSEWKGGQRRDGDNFGLRNARNVWTINTEPYRDAHFAVMPPELAERCIKAGTSEKGGCPHCGAPWVRMVDRPAAKTIKPCSGDKSLGYVDAGLMSGSARRRSFHGPGWRDAELDVSITTGWRPACPCPTHDPIPQTVIDPFAGAGTTGLAADRLQRNAMLIELYPKFTEMAERRVVNDAPLFTNVSKQDEQMRMFI